MNVKNDEQNFIEQNDIIQINPKDPKYPTLIHKVRRKKQSTRWESCWSMMMVLL